MSKFLLHDNNFDDVLKTNEHNSAIVYMSPVTTKQRNDNDNNSPIRMNTIMRHSSILLCVPISMVLLYGRIVVFNIRYLFGRLASIIHVWIKKWIFKKENICYVRLFIATFVVLTLVLSSIPLWSVDDFGYTLGFQVNGIGMCLTVNIHMYTYIYIYHTLN